MLFIDSLLKVLTVFQKEGSHKLMLVFAISVLGIFIELTGLVFLYLVINSLFSGIQFIILPIVHKSISTQCGVGILVFIYLLKFLYSIWQNRFVLNYCYQMNKKITTKLLQYFYNQSTETIKETNLADMLNKVFTIGGYFSEIIFQAVLLFFNEILLTLVIVISLLLFNAKLLILLFLILLPACIALLYFSRKKLKAMSGKILLDNASYHQAAMTMLHGLIDIKHSGNYAHFMNQFESKMNALHTTKKIITLESSFPPKVLEFVSILGIALLFLINHFGGNDKYIAGLVAAYATAAFRFIPSANRMISAIQNIQLYKEYIQFIHHINKNPTFPFHVVPIELGTVNSISMVDVNFAFDGVSVLKNISLNLTQSQIVGITGTSGAGKTTLINIVSGLLEPNSGSILINNAPFTQEIRNKLIQKSAYVMQEPYFLNGTISENIVFGYNSIDSLKIERCMRDVNLEEWLKLQPKGMETPIGDNGIRLSGGQKQRIAIARALYREANLLILDEPSNALDSVNKLDILSLVKQLTQKENLITLIVSHDEEILRGCHMVYELENGELKLLT